MIGIEPKRLEFRPAARLHRERIRPVARPVFRIVAHQIPDPVLALIINGQAEDRLWIDVQVKFRQTSGHAVKVVQATGNLGSQGNRRLHVFPEDATVFVARILALPVKQRLAVEVTPEMGIRIVGSADEDPILFGRLKTVPEIHAISVAIHRTAPALAVPPAVTRIDVITPIVGVVDVELSGAKVAKAPLQVLANARALFVAEIKTCRPSQPKAARRMLPIAEKMIARPRQQVTAPTSGVAGHPAEAALRLVERIIQIRQPEDRNLAEPKDCIAEKDMVLVLVFKLTRHVPMRVPDRIGAGRRIGRIMEDHRPVRRPLHRLASQRVGCGDGDNVSGCRQRTRDVVRGYAVGRKGHRLGGEKKC